MIKKRLIATALLACFYLLGALMSFASNGQQLSSQPQIPALQSLLGAQVAVSSHATNERSRALRVGFSEVLVRISGHADVLERSGIRTELSRANDYVIQYSYVSEQNESYLRMLFNEEKIVQLLRSVGASVWSAKRPSMMVWLVSQEPSAAGISGSLELIGQDSAHPILAGITMQAGKRGLQLSFPLLDLTDRLALHASDVWGRFEGPVLAATQRYPADGVVMVRLNTADDSLRAEWSFVLGSLRFSGVVQAEAAFELGVALTNAVVEQIANEYAVSFATNQQQMVQLRLLNVHQLEQVLAAEQMLSDLSPVVRLTLSRYHQGTAEFNLLVVGDKARVVQSLELDRRLQRIEDPWSYTKNDVLEYRWLR